MRYILFTIFMGTIFMGHSALVFARPEYALRNNFVSCTVCHYTPAGGDIRNYNGKLFGAHGQKISLISQKLKWAQIDARAEAFQSENATVRKGLMLMTLTPSAAVPIEFEDEPLPSADLVFSYGLGRLDTALGHAYLRVNTKSEDPFPFLEHILMGRFYAPFGLVTDEHRTFTRLATHSTNRDFETGVMFSGTPHPRFHYDFALTSGLQGDSPATDDSPWAAYLNLRFFPIYRTFSFGLSQSAHGTQRVANDALATSVYGGINLESQTRWLPLLLLFEYVRAEGWNNNDLNVSSTGGISYFIPSTETNWQDALDRARSEAILLQTQVRFSERLEGIIKAEQFIPDIAYNGDRFTRLGYGFKWVVNGQSYLAARYDHGRSTRPGITEAGAVKAVGDAYYIFYHLWL